MSLSKMHAFPAQFDTYTLILAARCIDSISPVRANMLSISISLACMVLRRVVRHNFNLLMQLAARLALWSHKRTRGKRT